MNVLRFHDIRSSQLRKSLQFVCVRIPWSFLISNVGQGCTCTMAHMILTVLQCTCIYIYIIFTSRDNSFDTGTASMEIWKMYLLNQCPQSHKQIVLSKHIGIALH